MPVVRCGVTVRLPPAISHTLDRCDYLRCYLIPATHRTAHTRTRTAVPGCLHLRDARCHVCLRLPLPWVVTGCDFTGATPYRALPRSTALRYVYWWVRLPPLPRTLRLGRSVRYRFWMPWITTVACRYGWLLTITRCTAVTFVPFAILHLPFTFTRCCRCRTLHAIAVTTYDYVYALRFTHVPARFVTARYLPLLRTVVAIVPFTLRCRLPLLPHRYVLRLRLPLNVTVRIRYVVTCTLPHVVVLPTRLRWLPRYVAITVLHAVLALHHAPARYFRLFTAPAVLPAFRAFYAVCLRCDYRCVYTAVAFRCALRYRCRLLPRCYTFFVALRFCYCHGTPQLLRELLRCCIHCSATRLFTLPLPPATLLLGVVVPATLLLDCRMPQLPPLLPRSATLPLPAVVRYFRYHLPATDFTQMRCWSLPFFTTRTGYVWVQCRYTRLRFAGDCWVTYLLSSAFTVRLPVAVRMPLLHVYARLHILPARLPLRYHCHTATLFG